MKSCKNLNLYIAIISVITLICFSLGIYFRNNFGISKIDKFNETKVVDSKDIYTKDKNDVRDIYITVFDGSKETLADLNKYKNEINSVSPKLEVRLDIDKAPASLAIMVPNATMETLNNSTSSQTQKSYKLEMYKKAGSLNGQKTLELNKEALDLTRIREKICLDYFKILPDTFSLRTQFCHVYIKDLTTSNNLFVDYGLYTDVERVDEKYLKNHALAENGNLYKAKNFKFDLNESVIKNVDDPKYNVDAFEEILSIRTIKDNSKLITMLNSINGTNNINQVIDKYFDRNNYITWLALNILTGNLNTNSQNYYIFSPITSEKWYFIPGNNNDLMGMESQPGSKKNYAPWQTVGVSNYWGSPLHKKFLMDPKNVEELTNKIEEISRIMTKERTEEMVKSYYDLTNVFVKSYPDIKYMPSSIVDYESEIKKLSGFFDTNKEKYYENFKTPMPVLMGEVKKDSNGYLFSWDPSFDFSRKDIYYNITVSTDAEFTNIIQMKKNIKDTKVNLNIAKKGTYYWKIDIYNSSGGHQIAFNTFKSVFNNNRYFGIKELKIS